MQGHFRKFSGNLLTASPIKGQQTQTLLECHDMKRFWAFSHQAKFMWLIRQY